MPSQPSALAPRGTDALWMDSRSSGFFTAAPHYSLGLGQVRAEAKGRQSPKPSHVSAKQGCAIG